LTLFTSGLVNFTRLKTWSVTSLSFITVFTPAVALLLGFIYLDERPTLLAVLGAGLILAGVAVAIKSQIPNPKPQ